MRKIIVTILAVFAIATLSAQDRGEMYLGGNLGISTSSISINKAGTNTTDFIIAPEYGYFVAKNFRVGASAAYTLTTGVATGSENATTLHTLAIMPNVAYYIRIMNSFYYTPSIELGFVCGVASGSVLPGCGLGLSLGSFELRPSSRFGIAFNLLSFEYTMMKYKVGNDQRIGVNGVNFRLGMTPSIGLKYYF